MLLRLLHFYFGFPFFFLMWWKILATLSMLCCCLFLFFFHSSHILYEHNYSQCRLTCIINYHFAHNTHTQKRCSQFIRAQPSQTAANSSNDQQQTAEQAINTFILHATINNRAERTMKIGMNEVYNTNNACAFRFCSMDSRHFEHTYHVRLADLAPSPL